MEKEIATVNDLLKQSCDCGVEVDPLGNVNCTHDPDCQYGKLLVEQERLSWLLAGVTTAVMGYLKPEESYAGKPIPQIEDAIVLREAFELACIQLQMNGDVPDISVNTTMCYYLKLARENCEKARVS